MKSWITLEVETRNEAIAKQLATALADSNEAFAHCDSTPRVIDVCPAPPQGSTIVGDMHEDEL